MSPLSPPPSPSGAPRLAAPAPLPAPTTVAAPEFDRLARLAAAALRAPLAWFCVADGEWLIIRGAEGLDDVRRESRLSRAVCRYVIERGAPLVVDDTTAPAHRRAVPELETCRVRAYLGVPVASPDGEPLGSLTVADRRPREWSAADVETLREVAASVTTELALRAELAARRASEARFRAIIEQGSDLVTVIDATGTVRYVSPSVERVLGMCFDDMAGCSAFDFVDPEDVPGLRTQLAALLAEPSRVEPLSYRCVHASGGRRTFEGTARNLLDVPGVRGIVVNATDVTERRALEGRLHHAQKLEAIGLLAGGIAHDFNNLLTVIRGNLEFVGDAVPADSQAAEDLREAERATTRASSLVRQLLAFGQRQQRRPTVLDLNAVVADAETLARRMAGDAIEVSARRGPALWAVRADRSQIEQVLMNLVLNARDALLDGVASGAAPTLTLETANVEATPALAERWGLPAPGEYVRLSVSDTGVGMDERTKAHLFEPFFTTKEVGRGTGLGLAVVYGIVAQSGGVVHVESAPGAGSRFSVLLPRVRDAVDGDAAAPARGPAARATGTLLLVEDEPAVRRATRRALERAGYRVHEARHAADALALWRVLGPRAVDALVTDARMPGIDGVDLAGRLREERADLPVVLVSGYAADALRARAETLGTTATRFLAKPYEAAELIEAVRDLVPPA